MSDLEEAWNSFLDGTNTPDMYAMLEKEGEEAEKWRYPFGRDARESREDRDWEWEWTPPHDLYGDGLLPTNLTQNPPAPPVFEEEEEIDQPPLSYASSSFASGFAVPLSPSLPVTTTAATCKVHRQTSSSSSPLTSRTRRTTTTTFTTTLTKNTTETENEKDNETTTTASTKVKTHAVRSSLLSPCLSPSPAPFSPIPCPVANSPEPLPLYISTKSIITYFNTAIDIQEMFWKLEVSPYTTPAECVIKKEIKLTSNTAEEVAEIKRKIADIPYVKEHIITHVNAADGRTNFKDVRKIIVGLSKKDITSCRIKEKGAFYNCLVLIMRIQLETAAPFREIHVKVFNTGKIEIPGIQSETTLQYILDKLVGYLQPLTETPLSFQDTTRETVLINSNFNCQFYINREVMFNILRSKYRVQCWYDPCCYPGIRCKYTDEAAGLLNVSFMIFRTGSVLIVGKCNEAGIYRIYDYVKNILRAEYPKIHQPISEAEPIVLPAKKKTIRKRKIYVEHSEEQTES